MKRHTIRVYPSKARLPVQEQLAWKIAAVAADEVSEDPDVQEMIINRIIDNAAVAIFHASWSSRASGVFDGYTLTV